MPDPILGRLSKIVTGVALAVASGGLAIAVAVPASAAEPGCTPVAGHYFYTDPSEILAYNQLSCAGGKIVNQWVSISELVNGTWVTVADGDGYATYQCEGSAEHEFSTTGSGTFSEPCG